ncbi:hypothetical protein MKW92_005251 [Papaver armeniacum]|nr:hypothetical protein MKW92_005251 [Papaver armeniacum]
MAASLRANGSLRFTPQSPLETSKVFTPRTKTLMFLNPRNPNASTRFPRIRAESSQTVDQAALTGNKPSSSSISSTDAIEKFLKRDYKWGFASDIESFSIPKGLSEETIRFISAKKQEPEWMLNFRLNSYKEFLKMEEPHWSDNVYPPIDLQNMCYYSEPKKKPTLNSLEEADPELLKYFERLGVPLSEQNRLANVAVDAVFDSVSIATTHRETLLAKDVIFCSISEAIREYPDLIQKYLGKVVPPCDNYYAALNSAVFSDGSFCYIPKNTVSPMPISTYFRINAMETGQFERTIIIAEEGSTVEYLEGCTAPAYDTNQLHAAVVELYAATDAEIRYSTVQNWYAGDEEGKGGIYNFVTKRGICKGDRAKISWTQVETGSAITWKYPSVIMEGDDSVGEFYSVTITNNHQQADTGSKMTHKGKRTKSTIISKSISAGNSRTTYRGEVKVLTGAANSRNFTQCDSMLLGDASANTDPTQEQSNTTSKLEHEATVSQIGTDQLFFFKQRGIGQEAAVNVMVSGFCGDVVKKLPAEFGAEVNELFSLKLEGSVG